MFWPLTFIIAPAVLLFSYYVPPYLLKQFWRKNFLAALRSSGCVCLTFDDGPNPEATPAILELLTKFEVRASFFCVGENAEKYPQLVRRIVAEGHELGEHTYWHTNALKTGPLRSYRDLTRGGAALRPFQPAGRTRAFRPPYGKLNLVTALYILLARKTAAFWDVDPQDFIAPSVEECADYVCSRLRPGATVLLHDDRRGARRSELRITIGSLEKILLELRRRNLKTATVSAALRRDY